MYDYRLSCSAYETHTVVCQKVHKKTFDLLSGIIPPTIAYRIEKALPDLLYRSLMPRLTHTLTRSVTHALVPVLSESITHTDRQDYFCYACYYHHKYCNLCHYSATTSYYNSYYATYYSDYYSDYYANYYASSVDQIEKIQKPNVRGSFARTLQVSMFGSRETHTGYGEEGAD